MKTGDILLSIFIILLFFIVYFINALAIDVTEIQNNWPKYRCNPSIMPFAGMLGPNGTNASDNFVYCVQNMQKNYMGHLLEPVNYNINVLSEVIGESNDSLFSARAALSGLRDKLGGFGGFSGIIPNIFGIFSNLMVEIQRNTINIKDTFSKMIGIIATFMFILDGSVKTTSSIWAGPPGSMIRTISKIKIPKCFHPKTLIKKENGEIVEIEDIKLGDVLLNNSVVLATLKIDNLDKNKNQISKFYKFEKSGEIDNKGVKGNIYVTGCHLVFEKESDNFIMVKNHKNTNKTNISSDYFICLITSNHLITIGDYIFHDWEDNNGSKSK
jgi:hypothetical protein